MVHRYKQVLEQRRQGGGARRPRPTPAAATATDIAAHRSLVRDAVALQQRLARGLNLRQALPQAMRPRRGEEPEEAGGYYDYHQHPQAAADLHHHHHRGGDDELGDWQMSGQGAAGFGGDQLPGGGGGGGGRRGGLMTRGPEVTTLSQAQWNEIEMRAEARGDATEPCAVCQETFGERGGEQVILSCSHMFHRACIASFERFLRTKRRTCPLCRKADYEKIVTTTGTRAFMARAAVKVQTQVRGWLARRKRRTLLKAYYAQGRGDPGRRQRFALTELSRYTESVTKAMEEDEASLTSLFAECANALAISRQVFREDERQQPRINSRSGRDHAAGTGEEPPTGDKWVTAILQAQKRGDRECPICMGEMTMMTTTTHHDHQHHREEEEKQEEAAAAEGRRALVILDCSHVFHEGCIHSYESFNIYEVDLCPVCRAAYQKALFLNSCI